MDAAVPANHQHCDLIAILRLDRRQNRSPGGAARFAIVGAAVLIAELPRPTVVRGIQIAVLLDERLGVSRAADGGGKGDEAAFANLFAVFTEVAEGKRHKCLRQ
ncbi:hypothetical protein D3C85_1630880 [compost metagenome]